MKYYDKLISNIIEVILKSENIKENISQEEFNKVFVRRLNKDIYVKYVDQFDRLLDLEETCYSLIHNSENKYKSNRELYKIAMDNTSNPLYSEIIDILKRVGEKRVDEISMFDDYFICLEDKPRFISILKELKVGPFRQVSTLNKEQLANLVKKNTVLKREQEKRINNAMLSKIAYNTSVSDVKTKNSKEIDFNYSNIVKLALRNIVDVDFIVDYSLALKEEELNELLYTLDVFQVFNKEELYVIKSRVKEKDVDGIKMDDIINYFVLKDMINPNELSKLIPFIGEYNYKYLVKSLQEYGINFNEEEEIIRHN